MNLPIAIGAENTLRLRAANAKATFVSFMVQMRVFRVRLDKAVVKSKEIPKLRSWVSVFVLKVRTLRMDIVGGMSVLSV